MGDKIEYKGYTIKIEPDCDPMHPRKDFDILGTMVCFHKRYNLGDKHDYKHEDYPGWDAMKQAICEQEDVAVILPLFLYDHSGITINTTGFSCPWDSGQVGFVFVSKEKVRKEYHRKHLTKKVLEQAKGVLVAETNTYDQYISGAVYGYIIEDEDENELDSCWGMYGHDYCVEEAKSIVDHYPSRAEKAVAAGI